MIRADEAGQHRFLRAIEPLVFAHRRLLLAVLAGLSLLLAWQATGLQLDAAFNRSQLLDHAYSRAEQDHHDGFDGANPVRIAVLRKAGTIYEPAFLSRLKALTEGLALLPGIDRRHLRSLFAPEVRYIEVSEGRYFGASVIAADFDPERATRSQLVQLRGRVAKAGVIGRYVSADQRGALIELSWLARDPATGAPLDQRLLQDSLTDVLRAAQATSGGDFSIHVIGAPALAKALVRELPRALLFAVAGLVLAALLLVPVLGSWRVALLSVSGALTVGVWQLGLIRLSGLVLDPDAVYAVALVIGIALIASAQFGLCWLQQAAEGDSAGFEASLQAWRQRVPLLGGGLLSAALAAAALAAFSDVPLSRQLGMVIALGLVAVIPVVCLLLPILLSGTGTVRLRWRIASWLDERIGALSALSRPKPALAVLVIAAVLAGYSGWQQQGQPIEPAGADLARLSADNPAKSDAAKVAAAFPRTVRELRVVVEGAKDACTDHDALEQLDQLVWRLENLPHVTGSTALPQTLTRVLTAFAEGSPKFRVLARNRETLRQAMAPISADSGLHADDCGTFPISLFLDRRDADTLATVAAEVARFNADNTREFFESRRGLDPATCASPRPVTTATAVDCPVRARLAGAPLGSSLTRQIALGEARATAAMVVIAVLALGAAVMLGNLPATLAVLLPLLLAGWIGFGLVAATGVALTSVTLSLWLLLMALGIGSHAALVQPMQTAIASGQPLTAALRDALHRNGRALLAALALAAGFALWIAAGYPAQRGVGKLLAIGFSALALSALVLLPATVGLLMAKTRPAGQRG